MALVTDRDLGWKKIKQELATAGNSTLEVGVFDDRIAEYATYNEFGTARIPSRPFMRITFDENRANIDKDLFVMAGRIMDRNITARNALMVVGLKHAHRIRETITKRNILPRLAKSTVKKKGSTKTLVDTGALAHAVTARVLPVKIGLVDKLRGFFRI